MKKALLTLTALMVCSAVAFAGDSTEYKHKMDSTEHKMEMKKDTTEAKAKAPEMTTTKLGVKYTELVVGEGEECKLGSKVECDYTLWFADDEGNKKTRFQSSKDPNPQTGKSSTFVCTLGRGLITGWSDGMVGMKPGGTRMMVIPPHLGYGKGGRGIPANTTLVFEIDLIQIIK